MQVQIDFERKPLLFDQPEYIISSYNSKTFYKAFNQIEKALREGLYVAGLFSYEAGYFFEPCLKLDKKFDFPLILTGAYKQPLKQKLKQDKSEGFSIQNLKLNISREKYASHINIIRNHIRQGDVYQITYCLKFKFNYRGNPRELYLELLKRQPVPYPAYISTKDFSILSLSPERFIKKSDTFCITEPMKGTWMRKNDPFSNTLARKEFSNDPKNRAENVMIADLLRNDLGRIGQDVRAPRLFKIAKYKTLFQMTSIVTANIKKDVGLYKLFSAIFPSGSVTGAPKIRAMQIIKNLEQEERKIYTGAIGYITPRRDLYFNIPIRTILIKSGQAEMGVGGGIVWDSTAKGEWEEGLLKAKFLTALASTP
ncbi:MAG: chorismate-binding protein, partial [Candidatus Omnitrophica bacterium]|nr:chorismate-binding protein [Candidatus Omnitrophota bacterium]